MSPSQFYNVLLEQLSSCTLTWGKCYSSTGTSRRYLKSPASRCNWVPPLLISETWLATKGISSSFFKLSLFYLIIGGKAEIIMLHIHWSMFSTSQATSCHCKCNSIVPFSLPERMWTHLLRGPTAPLMFKCEERREEASFASPSLSLFSVSQFHFSFLPRFGGSGTSLLGALGVHSALPQAQLMGGVRTERRRREMAGKCLTSP